MRSIVVLILILAIGFLGLWLLGGSKINVKNQNILTVKTPAKEERTDRFSDFGGTTPEETLKLFILALEKNNLALAAKYFIPENRETVSEDLTRLDRSNFLGDLISDLKNVKSGRLKNATHYYFEVTDGNDQTTTELELFKNQKGLWKIISL